MNIAIASLRVYDSSGVGCRSSSSITKREHQLPERMRQLWCGAPQLLHHHQARTQLPRAHASAPVWGAAAAPHHQVRTQLPECIRQLRCGAPQLLRHHQGAYTALPPRECTAAPVWGAAATPTSAPRVHASAPVWGASATPSSPSTHVNSSVGCRSNSVITERACSSSP